MKKCTKKIPKHNAGAIVGNSLNFVGDMTSNVVRSQNEGVSFGSVLGGMGKGAATGATLGSVIPGIGTIIGGIGGALVGGVTSAVGQSGNVDENTGEVTKSSGLTRLFGWGRSDRSLYAKSNRIKTSLADQQLTQDLNYNFYSDPNNSMNGSIFAAAAEGGIVPGEHYASRGEVEVAADGTNAVRYPWDPDGKDTYHVYTNPDGSSAMGNYVFTEEGVRRPNGEKYSDAAEKIIKGTEEGSKLRQISLRKLANEMEEQKMNKGIKKIKKGIPAHEEGLNPYSYNKNLTEFAYWDKDKNEYKKEYLDWVKSLTEQDVKDIFNGNYGDMSTYKGINPNYIPTVEEARKLMTDKKYGDWHKIGKAVIDKKMKKTITSPEDTVVRRPVYEEPVKVADTPVDYTKVYGREGDVRYDYLAPERKVNPAELGRLVDSDINYSGSNWRDGLYRMAVLSQPLWGRAKAEPVNYDLPYVNFVPTSIDVTSDLTNIDRNAAAARYDLANRYRNTGAGLAATLQLAQNRSAQQSAIRQWQTNAQNELIGKNVGIYNDWSKTRTGIMNDVYDKVAQNKAATRNINGQNMSAMLSNWGTMLRDDKQFDVDMRNNDLKTKMLEPFIQHVYGNSDELMSVLAQYGMGKNIKKKQNNN